MPVGERLEVIVPRKNCGEKRRDQVKENFPGVVNKD